MPTYGCLITAAGRAKIANAIATGVPVVLTEMSVGDGAGNSVTPSPAQSALVREVYRRTINAVSVSPSTADAMLIEMVIPGDVGPFVMREAGVWDEDGNLFAITALPTSVKPAPAEGATKDVAIIVTVKVENAAAVTVQVNPNIVIATRTWVDGNYLRLPGAGTTHQLIRKKSNNPNDWEFFDPEFDATGFVFDSIEEPQTLAADQTVVDFATITTAGIAVYVEKTAGGLERLARDQDYTILDETRIELAASYPADTRLLGVQNDPNGAVSPHSIGALARDENLGDLPNVAGARANLQLAYAGQADAEAGAEGLGVMSPLRVAQYVSKRVASQLLAEAGIDDNALMTPLKVKQLVDKLIPANRRGHEVGELGFFYRKSVPAGSWIPLRGGTFGPPGSGATVHASLDCWPLYEIWWADFSQALLPVTGGRGASALADWNAGKPMAIFNDEQAEYFYRAWKEGGGRALGSPQLDALQGFRLKLPLKIIPGSGQNWVNKAAVDNTYGSGNLTGAFVSDGTNGTPRIDKETRSINRAVLVCVHL